MATIFLAGAGTAEVVFPKEFFPTGRLTEVGYPENYTGVHDNPLLHILLIEAEGERYALCTLDMVGDWVSEKVRLCAEDYLQVRPENMLFHDTHTLSAPHPFQEPDDEQREKNRMREEGIMKAIKFASMLAVKQLRPAKIGFGNGITNINVNRVTETRDGWWQVTNEEGDTDHTVNVISIIDQEDQPIAWLYGVNTASSVLEHSTLSDGGQLISGDISGNSSRFIESCRNTTAIYLTSATADQWTAMRALHGYVDQDGIYHEKDFHESGFDMMEILSRRLFMQVDRAQRRITNYEAPEQVGLYNRMFTYPGQVTDRTEAEGPVRELKFCPAEAVSVCVYALRIGRVVIVSVPGEVTVATARYIKEHSPFDYTVVIEFARGYVKEQNVGYMPEREFYDKMTYQSRKCRVAKGSAERMREDVVEFLFDLRDGLADKTSETADIHV